MHLRLEWLHGLVAAAVALLQDRRLVHIRDSFVASFFSGTVALFLPLWEASGVLCVCTSFPLPIARPACVQVCLDSTVLSTVPPDTRCLLEPLLVAAVPEVRCFRLCFRSSLDGATAADFHSRCKVGSFRTHLTLLRSVKGPTLTLIKDTDGNVFGGYTAVEVNLNGLAGFTGYRYDPGNFLLTVVNPHADPPALFALTPRPS